MFFIVGVCFLALLSITLIMLWGHEKLTNKKATPHARIEEYWSGEERRAHMRFKHDIEVEYTVEKRPRINNGKSLNISKGGMKVLLAEKLPAGAIIDLKIQIPERKTIYVEGEVVWTKELEEKDPSGKRFFHSGIKFMAMKEPVGTRLDSYISHLEHQSSEV